MTYIDSLTHITPDGRWFSTAHNASLDRLLQEMDRAGISVAVVVALAGHIENDFVLKVCTTHPGRLLPGASLNPAGYATPGEAMRAAFETLSGGNFAVLKLHPRLHGYDPLDPRCLAVLTEIEQMEQSIPIWLDSIFRGSCPLSKPPVDTIHELALLYPKLRFVLLHGCGAQLLELAEILGACPNLTIDISLTVLYYMPSSLEEDIAFVLKNRDMRVVVGSDFPEYTPAQYIARIKDIGEKYDIPEDKLERVLGKNLKEILTL